MTDTNKRLPISESRGDLNRCTPCRRKFDQHTTYASHTSPRMSGVRFLWVIPIRGNLSWVIDRVEQAHWSREEGLPTQTTARHWPIRGSVLSFSSKPVNEAVRVKPNIYQRSATRLTGHISPVCDWYVQYLIVGVNPPVLNRHRRGLQPWRYRLSTYHSPTFPTVVYPFHLSAPPDLQFNQVLTTKSKYWVLKNIWQPRGLSTTRPSTATYIYA
jgi:hypothetical protein